MVRVTGDPTFSLVPEGTPLETRLQLRQEYGLDESLVTQFAVYLGKLAHGDLGNSFKQKSPVIRLIQTRLPATLQMTAGALVLVVLVGLPLGIYSAYWRGGRLDRVARFIAALGQSTPEFWVGILLILLFAVNLKVLPSGGHGSISHLILPSITLSFAAIAGLIRLLRSSMIEVLNSEYITFHRMKGLPESRVLWKHALRNGAMTSLSYSGLLIASLITGSLLVETVFAWPGIGRLMIEGVENRDFPVVQGTMLFFSAVYIGTNLVVDLLYAILNPRLR